MDGADVSATTVEEYLQGTPSWRTDLYSSSGAVGTLLTHAESIKLFRELGCKYTPELKRPSVFMPFNGFTQKKYAQKLIDEYKRAGVSSDDVWVQSFYREDIMYWIENEPRFGNQAVLLDDRYEDETFNPEDPRTYTPSMSEIYNMGVRIIAPPIFFLLTTNDSNTLVPSAYAREAYDAGLDIITWTLERSGAPPSGFPLFFLEKALKTDGDIMEVVHVLAIQVKVLGIFSDWPATVTFFANCFGL
ncbi:glycerophosphodiester phosphodiesterase [Gracilaria domingensis]|nr:glycerophosphodiester phosphodiesterase [Gracilaria domingensis]